MIDELKIKNIEKIEYLGSRSLFEMKLVKCPFEILQRSCSVCWKSRRTRSIVFDFHKNVDSNEHKLTTLQGRNIIFLQYAIGILR